MFSRHLLSSFFTQRYRRFVQVVFGQVTQLSRFVEAHTEDGPRREAVSDEYLAPRRRRRDRARSCGWRRASAGTGIGSAVEHRQAFSDQFGHIPWTDADRVQSSASWVYASAKRRCISARPSVSRFRFGMTLPNVTKVFKSTGSSMTLAVQICRIFLISRTVPVLLTSTAMVT